MTTATKTKPAKTPPPDAPPAAPAATEPNPLTLTLPALQFARAWGWVVTATSKDRTRPVLCAVNIEVHAPESVRLIATSSYELLHCWVSEGDDPGLDVEAPLQVLVDDDNGRVTALMRFLARTAGPMDRLRVDVDDTGVVFATDTETVRADRPMRDDRLEEFPNFRPLFKPKASEPADHHHFTLSVERLRWLAGIKVGKPGTGYPQMGPRILVDSPLGPIRLEWKHADPPLHGLVMPIRNEDR